MIVIIHCELKNNHDPQLHHLIILVARLYSAGHLTAAYTPFSGQTHFCIRISTCGWMN